MKEDYKSWPCGPVPEKWQRPEIKQLNKLGYNLKEPEIIKLFEKKISDFAGSKYGIATSSCTDAIFLSLQYLKYIGELEDDQTITIPARTYMSVPMAIKNCGLNVRFKQLNWSGVYQLQPTRIWDGSVRFTKDMYIDDAIQTVSFQYKKRLPIGKGGMILTDEKLAYEWLRQARWNGRHDDIPQWSDKFEIIGWNMYMSPDDAARGILLFNDVNDVNPDSGCQDNYPDLSNQRVFL